MDGSNLLSGGEDILIEIRETLIDRQAFQAKRSTLAQEEQKLEKSIQNAEKEEADEIASTIRKRRQEIEDSFDKQIDNIGVRIKKTRDKRDKRKNLKMSERIEAETASLREENTRLKMEIRTLLKQKHVPAYCNSRIYFALYMPKYLSDILLIICALLLTLLIVPCGFYFFLLPEEKILYLILTYIAVVILFGSIYLLIGSHTKDKFPGELKQILSLRARIRSNVKKINGIKKNIKKDGDESTYELESFDEELDKLNNEQSEIVEQKKEALLAFENTTSRLITSGIKDRHSEKLASLRADYDKVCNEASDMEGKIKALMIKMASEYEPLIGKDLLTVDRLDSLINIIKAGNASTISEAVAFYKINYPMSM